MSKHILITGGTGYIGSHTVVELIAAGFTPILVDNLSNSRIEVLDSLKQITGKDIIFFQGDCRDNEIYTRIFSSYSIETVIHFAAFKSVNESILHPLDYYDNNINSLLRLLESMQEHGVKNIVFSSSCTVYGEPETEMVTEESPLQRATSPYGETKKMGERILQDVCSRKNVRSVFLRYFNPVGAHPSGLIGEEPKGIPNNLFPFVIQTIAGLHPKISIFGNDYSTPDGTCIRDFVHVVDLARAHVAAISYFANNLDFDCDVFNIGTGVGTSVLEVIKGFEKITGFPFAWEFAPRRKGDIVRIYARVEKAKRLLDWQSHFTVQDAIEHTWKRMLHQKNEVA